MAHIVGFGEKGESDTHFLNPTKKKTNVFANLSNNFFKRNVSWLEISDIITTLQQLENSFVLVVELKQMWWEEDLP